MIEGLRILLVDDNAEIVDSLSTFLLQNYCTVFQASRGDEAKAILGHEEIDIALLDIQLPDTDGISLLDMIKVQYPITSVIMMTGHHDFSFVIEAMKKGASDFLMKPFEFDKLMLILLRVSKERELLIEKQHMLHSLEDKKKIEILNRELQDRIEELTTMYHISSKFNSFSIFEDIYERIVHIISEVLEIGSCGYYVIDPDNHELILYRQKENTPGSVLEKKVQLAGELANFQSPAVGHFTKGNSLFLPVRIKGECVGFIMVGNQTNGRGQAKRFSFLDRDVLFLKQIVEKASIQIENRMLYESLFENILHTLTSLVTAVNRRDLYTEGHCKRVTSLSLALAEPIRLSEYERDALRIIGPLHDLGKIGIPDSVLLKAQALTDEEYQVMKWHSTYGEEIVGRFNILLSEAKIIRHHHERFDGKGYPDGLMGDEIPIAARAIAVCDAFDAMTTNRPYRRAMSRGEALAEIAMCRGKQFDPDVTDIFLSLMGSGRHE
jgi:response regulator RpfG family c-di-GMP phosphodiesterase